MTDKQPDALQLAGWLEHIYVQYDGDGMSELLPAAAELRRLHSVNAQLLEALEQVAAAMPFPVARAAIAAAKEQA